MHLNIDKRRREVQQLTLYGNRFQPTLHSIGRSSSFTGRQPPLVRRTELHLPSSNQKSQDSAGNVSTSGHCMNLNSSKFQEKIAGAARILREGLPVKETRNGKWRSFSSRNSPKRKKL
ncbi:hypothetical protein OIU84_010478 [Salix udensis]|uniref:Uncharacterized protein n=1 Tax=Salix udensis TaxID=889485 RepID=A0AAD6JKU2_9ROSI|nr:hypothetical protein OIU84_010478 [Salix udensis]